MSFSMMSQASWALERNRPNEEAAGEVVTVKGTVMVRQDSDGKSGHESKGFAIKPGQNVYAGDVINTSSDGAIKILLKDKSIVDLGESSLFKVAGFKANEGANRQVDLDMKFGRLRVSVSKKITEGGSFKVKTKAATMGVRGTEFIVNSAMGDKKGGEAPKTDVTVLQGKVDVKAPSGPGMNQEVKSLVAGGKISAQVGASAQMMQVSPQQMKMESAMAKVSDNTFFKAISIEPKAAENANSRASERANDNSAVAGGKSEGGSDSDRSPASAPAAEAGSVLAASVTEMAAQAPVVPISVTEIGVPGAPSVTSATTMPTTQVNRSYRVTVIVGAQ